MVGLVTMVEMVTSTSLPMDTQLLCTSLLSAAQTLTIPSLFRFTALRDSTLRSNRPTIAASTCEATTTLVILMPVSSVGTCNNSNQSRYRFARLLMEIKKKKCMYSCMCVCVCLFVCC
eukprot:m.125075 g.125075  ORF g.125075 m.125075 type:complete len:118 (-) comp12974_c0_seq1:76-429(-)